MSNAFYYRGDYWLVPAEFPDAQALLAHLRTAAPCTLAAVALKEHHWKQGYVNGHSLAPYFISDYLKDPQDVTISSADEVFPVQATLLSQKEYNTRLRALCLAYCPGCRGFSGKITEKDSSLRWHHGEISLDGVCLLRWETKPAPPAFRDPFGFARLASYLPVDTAEHMMEFLKSKLHLRYNTGELLTLEDGTLELRVQAKKADFYLAAMTKMASMAIQLHNARRVRLVLENAAQLSEETILAQLTEENAAIRQKNCRQYGVGLGVLAFPEGQQETMLRYLEPLLQPGFAMMLHTSANRIYLLFADMDGSLARLRYHSPMVSAFSPTVTLYDHEKIVTRRLCFTMDIL